VLAKVAREDGDAIALRARRVHAVLALVGRAAFRRALGAWRALIDEVRIHVSHKNGLL